jgi:UDP-N-acetyl-D-mannosaminuronic acid transferase (WecB/TagA/CpsF family)
MSNPITHFLGIPFWNADTELLLRSADKTGGSLTVPSAPSLAQADKDAALLRAYQESDYAVVDGGYIALILRWVLGKPLPRISGLQLIEQLFICDAKPIQMKERRVLWVVPNEEEKQRIEALMARQGFDAAKQHYYLAPFYQSDDAFKDTTLGQIIDEFEADWVILCIGGGRQEKLAYWLSGDRAICDRKPAVLCTGAAIAFFTGGQASIPEWADRLYLGWLFRIFENPKLYIPRYFAAFYALPRMLWRRRKELTTKPLDEH